MVYEKEIAALKAEIMRKKKDPTNDTSKPYKKQIRLEIRVTEKEDGKADLELFYDQRYYRMFGQHDTVWQTVLKGVTLKAACEGAKQLKKQLPTFSILYTPYEQIEYIM
jgi:hypothetical protein